MKKPIVSDLVWYGPANLAAIVVAVHSGTNVDLLVFSPDGSANSVQRVEYGDEGWTWPKR